LSFLIKSYSLSPRVGQAQSSWGSPRGNPLARSTPQGDDAESFVEMNSVVTSRRAGRIVESQRPQWAEGALCSLDPDTSARLIAWLAVGLLSPGLLETESADWGQVPQAGIGLLLEAIARQRPTPDLN